LESRPGGSNARQTPSQRLCPGHLCG
jgi:hypothetical protein